MDAAGQLAAALAYGANDRNSYTTQTEFHLTGGVSISGSWDSFATFYGSNTQPGASSVSASFSLRDDSLVVVIGLAASQQKISLRGIPGLRIDASNLPSAAGGMMVIAHAYLWPGTYTVIENSAALSGGQEPRHMADLIGVFVFGSKQ